MNCDNKTWIMEVFMITREQAKKNLVDFGIEEPTEDQITNYLNQVNNEALKEKIKADKLKEKADLYDQTQAELEAEKQKNMSAEEKVAAAELAAKEKEKEFVLKTNRLEAKAIYAAAGISDEDAEKLLEKGVFESLEDTKAFAQSIVDIRKTSVEAAVQKTKEDLMDGTRTPGDDGKSGSESEKSEDEKFAEEVAASFGGSNKESEKVFENY